jgi:N-acetylglucosaminyldiphosphoundecaprenol N-acetyl-beta-D-mannosaminyltransferase
MTMIDGGKRNLLGVLVNVVDYEAAVEKVIDAARAGEPLGVSALAVHGVMTGVLDRTHRSRLNQLELVVPDGQPVRWALNVLHHSKMRDRVYGPTLTLKVCQRAAAEKLPIYLYGSMSDVLEALAANLTRQFTDLEIAGLQPSKFRRITAEEKRQIVEQIRGSGAKIVLLGLGCPRQEAWAYEYRQAISMPVLAVGAAFDYHAGRLRRPPEFLQRFGLEWAFRLSTEPRRLWRRYLLLNPYYLAMVFFQLTHLLKMRIYKDDVEYDVLNYG